MHYLNNAGASLMSGSTLAVMQSYLELETKIGGYEAATKHTAELKNMYESAAYVINAQSSDCVAYMDSASRAWNLALYGLPLKRGDKIITLSSEFGTNLVSVFHFANKIGATVEVIACSTDGQFDLELIRKSLSEGARLVAISHAAAHGSMVNPVEEIGALTRHHGALYLVDGCQSVGQMDVDVQRIGCDAYTATGRKWLRGPRGTGFLYVAPSATISPTYVDLASADLRFDADNCPVGVDIRRDARRFEIWERNIAGVLGLGNALREFRELETSDKFDRMRAASKSIRKSVADHGSFELVGKVDSLSSVVGFFMRDPTGEDRLRNAFKSSGITFSAMSDWDCPMHFPKNGAKSIFRLAPHYYTSDETIEAAIKVVESFH